MVGGGNPSEMRVKVLSVALIALLVIASTFRYIHRAPKRQFSDFHVLYVTSQRLMRGEQIYTFKGDLSFYKYPVFYVYLLGPLGKLDEFKAALIWHFFNWVFLSLIFISWLGMLRVKRRILITSLGFVFAFRFILENLDQGQANISFLAFSSIALYLYFKGRKNLSSLTFAISILSKYLSILFLPFFLIRREYKFVLKILFLSLLLYFLPALTLGVDRMIYLFKENVTFLFKSSLDKYSITCYPNQSLLAALMRAFSDNPWYERQLFYLPDQAIKFLFIFIALFLYILAVSNFKDGLINIGLICLLIPLLNPNGWKNNFIWMLGPSMVMFSYFIERKVKDGLCMILLLLSFLLASCTSEFFVYGWAGDWFEVHSFVTLGCLALFFALYRLGRLANEAWV